MALGLFKEGVTVKMMTTMIDGITRHRAAEIIPIFEKIGAIYDEAENHVIIMAVNYEIMRSVLLKSNPKEKVEQVINGLYNKFFDSLKVEKSTKEEYQLIMGETKKQTDEIFFTRQTNPTRNLIYQAIISLQNISQKLFDYVAEQEVIFTIENWLVIAKQVNNKYRLVDEVDGVKDEQPIDFDF